VNRVGGAACAAMAVMLAACSSPDSGGNEIAAPNESDRAAVANQETVAQTPTPLAAAATIAVAGFLSFSISAGLSFPDDELKEIVIVQAEKALGPKYKVRIDELDVWWFTGVSLDGIQIEERVNDDVPIDPDIPADLPMKVRITSVRARLTPLLSLFHLAPTVEFEVDVDGGIIEGTASFGSEGTTIRAQVDKLDLRTTPALASFTGVPFFGELSADIEWTLSPKLQPTAGFVRLSGSQLTLGPATVMTEKFPPMTYFEIPQTNFGTLAVDLEFSEDNKTSGLLKIKKMETSGRDIRLEAWGSVDTATTLKRSKVDVKMRTQLDETFVKKNSIAPFLNVNEVRKGKNRDWYGFTISGIVDRIQFKGSTDAATGPKELAKTKEPVAPEK